MSEKLAGLFVGVTVFLVGCVTVAYCSAKLGAPLWASAALGGMVGIIAAQSGLYYGTRGWRR